MFTHLLLKIHRTSIIFLLIPLKVFDIDEDLNLRVKITKIMYYNLKIT